MASFSMPTCSKGSYDGVSQRIGIYRLHQRSAGLPAARRPALAAAPAPRGAADATQHSLLAAASTVNALAAAPVASAPVSASGAYSKIQNGSDVRGVALDLVPGEGVTLTPSMMFFIGSAFADWLAQRAGVPTGALRASVGRDPRLSSPLMAASIVAGMASRGVAVARFGLCTTPAMFMSCVLPGFAYDGAIMITASHLPPNRNGAKFFTAEGGLAKKDITWLLTRAAQLADEAGMHPADRHNDHAYVVSAALQSPSTLITHVDFLEVYSAYLRGLVIEGVAHPAHRDRPLAGLKIVVDPGNGAGGFFATRVLGPLGADVSASINLAPDGSFPAHIPNPEDKGAVAATREAVLTAGADLGIMLDTDVDRSGMVDRYGAGINRNRYIALMAAIALRENPGEAIVTDSCTSNGLAAFIVALGGRHFRYKKGYKNIIDKGMELNQAGVPCPLMMETSGHGAMRENYFLDDGAYSALKVVIEAVRRRLEGGSDVSDMLSTLREPAEAMEIRVKITAEDVRAEGAAVTAAFQEWAAAGAGGAARWRLEEENYEGWRVKVDEGEGREGWVLLRPSLHDPDVVLNVESELEGGMRTILADILPFFAAHPDFQVSTAAVEKYVAEGSA